jgi:hypothetical protein
VKAEPAVETASPQACDAYAEKLLHFLGLEKVSPMESDFSDFGRVGTVAENQRRFGGLAHDVLETFSCHMPTPRWYAPEWDS